MKIKRLVYLSFMGILALLSSCTKGNTNSISTDAKTSHSHSIETKKEDEILPTCEKDGEYIEVEYCKECNEILSKNKVIVPASGHKNTKILHENIVEATCQKEGSYDEITVCVDCGEYLLTQHVASNPIAHDYENGACTYCGDKEENSEYTLLVMDGNTQLLETKNRVSYDSITKEGFNLVGLYYDEEYKVQYTYEKLTKDTTLYARFVETNSIESVLALAQNSHATTSGVVVGVNERGFLLWDYQDYILVYNNTKYLKDLTLGDYVSITDSVVSSYAARKQLKDASYTKLCHLEVLDTYRELSLEECNSYSGVTNLIDCTYIMATGTVSVNNSNYSVTILGASMSLYITYPSSSLELSTLVDKEITFSGYITGVKNNSIQILFVSFVESCQHTYTLSTHKDSSCQSEGYDIYVCSTCGASKTDILEKTNHDYTLNSHKDSTCTEKGYQEYICKNCQDTYKELIGKVDHQYHDGVCIFCNVKESSGILQKTFGEVTIYTSEDENPYGVDLSSYGSDCEAIFYTPTITSVTKDPYQDVTSEEFYKEYTRASSYEDAYFRSKHYFMSGDITPQNAAPVNKGVKINNQDVRCSKVTYILSSSGDYIGYVPNTTKEEYILYYGGGYQSMNEVAAYLFAFGEVPLNSNYDKGTTGKNQSLANWGIYGRVNLDDFSGPQPTKYQYEPNLANAYAWKETDFGNGYEWIFEANNNQNVSIYNTGSKINRGVCRFIYVSDGTVKNTDNRHVWYTYNHYNDFQAYLNYDDGFGAMFGNITAGNAYNTYDADNPPTQYPVPIVMTWNTLKTYL